MSPVSRGAEIRILKIEHALNSHQGKAREEEEQTDSKEQITDAHCTSIRTIVRVPNMKDAENDDGQDQYESKREMRQEHVHIEIVLKRLSRGAFDPTEKGDTGQINGVCTKQCHQGKDGVKEKTKPRTHCAYVLYTGRRRLRNTVTAHTSIEMLKENLNRIARWEKV